MTITLDENSIATLQTECKGARIKLQEELLNGKRLLIESNIDFEGRDITQIKVSLKECRSRLITLGDELCEINRKLALATRATEMEIEFEKQMDLDFGLMNLSDAMYSSLDYLRLSLINIKIMDENERRKENEELCLKIDKIHAATEDQEEQLIQQHADGMEKSNSYAHVSYKENKNTISTQQIKAVGVNFRKEKKFRKKRTKTKNKTKKQTLYKLLKMSNPRRHVVKQRRTPKLIKRSICKKRLFKKYRINGLRRKYFKRSKKAKRRNLLTEQRLYLNFRRCKCKLECKHFTHMKRRQSESGRGNCDYIVRCSVIQRNWRTDGITGELERLTKRKQKPKRKRDKKGTISRLKTTCSCALNDTVVCRYELQNSVVGECCGFSTIKYYS